MAKNVKITWIVSKSGHQAVHGRTIRALGLHRLHESVVKELTPAVQGMIRSVEYMLRVEEVSG
jgi:large subunit ribosomal protein L30